MAHLKDNVFSDGAFLLTLSIQLLYTVLTEQLGNLLSMVHPFEVSDSERFLQIYA